MSAESMLRELVSVIPVPGSPTRLSGEGAAIGLAFLDASLSLAHVKRLTETITVHERAGASKRTEVDVDLALLGRDQRIASGMLAGLVRPPGTVVDGTEAPVGRSDEVWVPIARVPRTSSLPVPVLDGRGRRLPTLTQFETSRLVASGLYRLLRGILQSHEDARDSRGVLGQFLHRLHEPRWLVQKALFTLVTGRVAPLAEGPAVLTEGTVSGQARQHRAVVTEILDRYGPTLSDYFDLLDTATDDYLLVVALDAACDEHLLSYESTLTAARPLGGLRDLGKIVRVARDGYHVEYRTTIPSTLRAYHLVVRTADDVGVHGMYLSTDADDGIVSQISDDLATLAGQLRDHREAVSRGTTAPTPTKMLELELQAVLQRLADVLRRRRWDAARADLEVPAANVAAAATLGAATAGEAVGGAAGPDHSPLAHPLLKVATLERAAAEVRVLARDVHAERPTSVHEAHAYWGRPSHARIDRQLDVRAGFVLRDAGADGWRSVTLYSLAVSVIAFSMAALITDGLRPFAADVQGAYLAARNADAVVAVLLLLPSFLYTRLTLPRAGSVAGLLRLVPRAAAQGSILLVAALCAAMAAQVDAALIAVMFEIATFTPLAVVVAMQALRAGRRRAPVDDLARLGAPAWILPERRGSRRRAPDLRLGNGTPAAPAGGPGGRR